MTFRPRTINEYKRRAAQGNSACWGYNWGLFVRHLSVILFTGLCGGGGLCVVNGPWGKRPKLGVDPLGNFLLRHFRGSICLLRFHQSISTLQAIQITLTTANTAINLTRAKGATIVTCRRNTTYLTMVLILTILQRITLISTTIMIRRSN